MRPNTGVYQIRNKIDGKRYVGSVAQIGGFEKRWSTHRSQLSRKCHHSIKLQRAWNKHGADAFVFEVLLRCRPEDCVMHEQMTIDLAMPEYNICLVAGSCLGRKQTTKTKRLLSEANHGRKHPQFGKPKSTKTRIRIARAISKLTENDVKTIRLLRKNGVARKYLATRFQVSTKQIYRICTNQRWKHVK